MMWNGYGMMGGFGWFWPFHFIVPLLIVGLVIWAIVAAVRGFDGHHWRGRLSPGLDALDERYAKGEINRDEYMQKRRDILG